jgi:hypothetical protein
MEDSLSLLHLHLHHKKEKNKKTHHNTSTNTKKKKKKTQNFTPLVKKTIIHSKIIFRMYLYLLGLRPPFLLLLLLLLSNILNELFACTMGLLSSPLSFLLPPPPPHSLVLGGYWGEGMVDTSTTLFS